MISYNAMRKQGYTGKPKYFEYWLKEQRQLKLRKPRIKKFGALISGQILRFNSDAENNKNVRKTIICYCMMLLSFDNEVEDAIQIEVEDIVRKRDVSKLHYVSEFF